MTFADLGDPKDAGHRHAQQGDGGTRPRDVGDAQGEPARAVFEIGGELFEPGGKRSQFAVEGIEMFGVCLGEAAGTPYEALLAERICGPLGLTETGFRAQPVQGYNRGRPVPPWDMAALAAAGGLYSTATDLARLLAATLMPDQTPLGPAIRTALEPRRPIAPGADTGLGWRHLARRGAHLTWHNGMTGGYTAVIAFNPARRTGAVALANTGGTPPSPMDAVVFDALSAP